MPGLGVFGAIEQLKELQQVALDRDAAIAKGVAEVEVRIGHQAPERRTVVDDHPAPGLGGTERLAVPKHQGNGRATQRIQQPPHEPPLDGPDVPAAAAGAPACGSRVGGPLR